VCPAELAAIGGVSAVVGAREQGRLVEVVRGLLARARVSERRAEGAAGGPQPALGAHARPILKIQDGCSAHCAYCIVPLARGPGRSVPPDEVLLALRAHGAASAEVVLAGVHLGAYGHDLAPRSSLDVLLELVARARPVRRLRLSSVEPHELPVAALAGAVRPLLCEHLHLPVQSGSDAVLRAMRRPYRSADAARALDVAASLLPGAAIGLDLLCGFPGETDEDHRATARLVESSPATYLHVFGYSPRPGTDAARLAALPPDVVQGRVAELRAIGARRWSGFLDGLVGREVEVVVERLAGGIAHGTSREFAAVRWPARGEARGEAVRVNVAGRDGEVLLGARAV
jgi:threonylcarbamoyladenosine tRNA methylthiotransferase MtaB